MSITFAEHRQGYQGPLMFTWGKVIAVHSIGNYSIVEFAPRRASNVAKDDFDPSPQFHPFIKSPTTGQMEDTNRSYSSLDGALVGAIAYRTEWHNTGNANVGANSKASIYFGRMIGGYSK